MIRDTLRDVPTSSEARCWRGALAGLAFGGALACSRGAPAPTQRAAPDLNDVSAFAPFTDGTVLSYDTESDRAGRGVIVLQVRRPRPELVELDDGGHVERIYVSEQGLRYATGGHWLKAPLREGACWAGRAGQVCITSVSETVQVPAGELTGCVVTIERVEGVTDGARTRTVFCPGVGMALLEVEGWAEDAPVRERAALRYAGPRVELNLPPP